ncbi:MAG: SDR family oxidoreductase [Myxococcaceae bacterium]|nr:SDR family oxidoreductase [Myxococcaceae bacterium]
MSDRFVVVTGASSGIGRTSALELARRGHRVVLACRSLEKATPVLQEVRRASPTGAGELLPLDLANLASVQRFARDYLDRGWPLHVLLNNAGVAGHRGTTEDGFELQFGTNHLGHFLLTELLLPRLRASAPARVVFVSSGSHYACKRLDFDALRGPTRTLIGLKEYEVSKLCNVLHARELARREGPAVATFSLHPGVVDSDAFRRVPGFIRAILRLRMISDVEGAKTSVYCATQPDLESGLFWDECRPKRPSPLALDDALARELWARSEAWVAPFR